MARLSARCPMLTAAVEYPAAMAASACRTSAADRSRSLPAPMTFRRGSRTFWFLVMILGERPSSPWAPRADRRTRSPQPRHRRGRPPLEPLARPPGRKRGRRAAEPERQPPDRAGSARLTCGQHPSQTPSAQVSPKRENLSS
jgi:hypothetical protein